MQPADVLASPKPRRIPLPAHVALVWSYSILPLSVILFQPIQAAISLIEPSMAKARWWLTGKPWSLLIEEANKDADTTGEIALMTDVIMEDMPFSSPRRSAPVAVLIANAVPT